MSKDLDATNPKVRVKWEDSILFYELPKGSDWGHIRIVGPIFSYAQHWIEFIGKEGTKKIFPVTCTNYNQDTEQVDLENGCPCCELGMKHSTKYLINIIDRKLQRSIRAGSNPIRAITLPPTAVNQIIALKQLNIVDDKPVSVSNAKYGCDIAIQLSKDSKKSEWRISLGKQTALTEEELEYELFDFDSIFIPSDNSETRRSLIQKGYKFNTTTTTTEKETPQKLATSNRVEESDMPSFEDEGTPSTDEDQEDDTLDNIDDGPQEVPATPAPKAAPATPPAKEEKKEVAETPKKKLGAPPSEEVKKASTEVPDCFSDGKNGKKYLRGVRCLKCAHKKNCADNTNKMISDAH
jgi:hypothetical protein